MNNAVYLAYLEDCAVQAATVHGWPRARMQTEGFAITARRHQIEYRQPAVLDDELEVATWISDVECDTAVRHYTITRVSDGGAAGAGPSAVEDGGCKDGAIHSYPAKFRDDLAPNVVGHTS